MRQPQVTRYRSNFLESIDVKAAYTFFNRSELTPEVIQAGHKGVVKANFDKQERIC